MASNNEGSDMFSPAMPAQMQRPMQPMQQMQAMQAMQAMPKKCDEGHGGWIAFIILLVIFIIVLSSLAYYNRTSLYDWGQEEWYDDNKTTNGSQGNIGGTSSYPPVPAVAPAVPTTGSAEGEPNHLDSNNPASAANPKDNPNMNV
jgi:hypothetical protein